MPSPPLVVILRGNEVVITFQRLDVPDVFAGSGEVRKLRRHADDEVFALTCVVVLDQFQGGGQDSLVVGEINRALFKIDIQAIKAIGFHQADNLAGQWLFVAFMQFDVCIGAAKGNQHRPALAVQHTHLATELGVGQLVRGEGWDTVALHEGHGHHVVILWHIHQAHIGELATLVAIARAGRPVVPEAHEDLFAGNARHQRSGIVERRLQ